MKNAILMCLLLLVTPALAQDAAPVPTPADLLAKVLKDASDKKLLQHRLLTKRYYKAEERGGVVLVTGEGSQSKQGLEFKLSAQVFARGATASLTYRFDPAFKLQTVVMEQKRQDRTRRETIAIAGGKTTATRSRDGQVRGRPRDGIWTGDRISLFSAWVLLSSLGDLGLKPETKVLTVREDDDIGKGRQPTMMILRRQAATKTSQTVLIDRDRNGRVRPVAKAVLGVGKDQGVIREFLIDPKPDGRSDLHLKLITGKEAQELLKAAPLLMNEGRVMSALSMLRYAQQNHQRTKNEFASTIEELAASRSLYDKSLAEGKSPGYMVLLRRSPDKQSWMALAVPDELGKTGRYYFVTNTDGKVFRSKKAIELKDDCKIPANLEQVGR